MFKHIKIEEQLRQAQGEVNRLKSIVGEFPKDENTDEFEEKEQKNLVGEIEKGKMELAESNSEMFEMILMMTGGF